MTDEQTEQMSVDERLERLERRQNNILKCLKNLLPQLELHEPLTQGKQTYRPDVPDWDDETPDRHAERRGEGN